MAELLSIATMVPEHCVTGAELTRELTNRLEAGGGRRIGRLLDAVASPKRHIALPLPEVWGLETIDARTRSYAEHAVPLAEAVARDALRSAGIPHERIAAVIGVSSTGYLAPTLETRVAKSLGLPPSCRRVPLTHLGCAGGAAGLALAATLADALADPVLVLAVELPSVCLPNTEPSLEELIASVQYGDGAAAAILGPEDSSGGAKIVAAGSFLVPEALGFAQVQLTTAGFRLGHPRRIAEQLRRHLPGAVERFLTRHAVSRHQVTFWGIHPRNLELLDAAAESLHLPSDAVAASRAVWERQGNTISAGLLAILAEMRVTSPPLCGSLGMLIAMAADVSVEMVLLRSGGWLSDSFKTAAHNA